MAPLASSAPSEQAASLLRRYQLLIEYKNLRSPQVCPSGVYVIPDPTNMDVWHATMFIHRGFYKEAVFKFIIDIPPDYPASMPGIRFITNVFHPLIDGDGVFTLDHQFPHWRPGKDLIAHVLHYVKASFRESAMSALQEPACSNVDAYRTFKQERSYFARLAAQCAQMSSSEAILFDKDSRHLISFTPIDDVEFANIQDKVHETLGLKR
ncbi:ubiquitin-conjugating enzyme/RWD-like protein [Entophlyctis helioformis]|nr:ubiquitin-conjugating enzyme/RWD-like protein [Entophlyctis helioformis]